MDGWSLLAQADSGTAATVVAILTAAGATAALIFRELSNRAKERASAQREAEASQLAADKERSAIKLAEEAARVSKERVELEWVLARHKELQVEANERLAKVEDRMQELAKEHRECEVQLAQVRERLRMLEGNGAKRI